jgi:adenylate kinase
MNLILLGPQGSGKGAQAELLSKKFSLPALSMGQLYRRQIQLQTKIGKRAKRFVLTGKLVPDKITEELLRQELKNKKYKNGVIFDGFPRTQEQNKFLEQILKIDYVILIHIRHEEILKRLSGRYVCACGLTYNLYAAKSRRKFICDKCGSRLKQRPDDTPRAIKQRLEIYEQETIPLAGYYKKQHKLITISGEKQIEQVFKAILLALKRKGIK